MVLAQETKPADASPHDLPAKRFEDYSLEELLQLKIRVASDKAENKRKSPGVVTLVTKKEIENSGARDLIDVLRLVPGFDFGVDVFGVVGVGFRGNWGHEGKVLLLVDGQEFNELMYTNLEFGNHISVDQIDRIEIIRGPGSAIYGGYAELAVINILTKIGNEREGLNAFYASGYMESAFARQNLGLSYGHTWRDLYVGASGFFGLGNRSDRDFADFYGGAYNLAGNSALNPANANLNLRYKTFKLRFLFDDYRTTNRDAYDTVSAETFRKDFTSYFVDASYGIDLLGGKMTVTPQFKWKRQQPWNNRDTRPQAATAFYDAVADRYSGILKISYDITNRIKLLLGGQLDYDDASYGPNSPLLFTNGTNETSYRNFALFSEGAFNTPIANLTLGARFENHNAFGSSFVPRVGVTKVVKDFHGKFLYSRAFRAPGIEQIHFGDASITGAALKPEKTDDYEVEAGYRISDTMYVSANYFNTHISHPIIYFFDTANQADTYVNRPEVGTTGVEVEYRVQDQWGYATLGYSFYNVTDNQVTIYAVPGNGDILLGFPQHKATLNGSFNITSNLSVNPSVVFMSQRYGYDSVDANGVSVIRKFSPKALANLYFLYRNAFVKGLDIGAGVYDIFNQSPPFLQPYDGYHAPLPGPSREYVLKMTYNWQ